MSKYPNLVELNNYHPYHYTTLANFAEVTKELYLEALRGNKELTREELVRISRYMQVPVGVLASRKLIMMDKDNRKHQRMIQDLEPALYSIWEAEKAGSKEAGYFMRGRGRMELVNLELAFQRGEASYCRYLGVKENIEQCFYLSDVSAGKCGGYLLKFRPQSGERCANT